jgi:hypothetical protein
MPVLFTLNGVRGRKPVRACRFFDGGDAAHHVLKAGFVGLVVGDVFDWRGTTGAVLHCPGQVFDGDFLSVADVNDFADGADSIRRIRPSTVSRTSQKQRDRFPVPSMLMGRRAASAGLPAGPEFLRDQAHATRDGRSRHAAPQVRANSPNPRMRANQQAAGNRELEKHIRTAQTIRP